MADEYDPLDPPTYDAANGDDDDEDAYEPDFTDSANDTSMLEAQTAASANASAQPSQPASREQSAKPKTVGGFILEESDDEEDQQQHTPVPSQLNGTHGAQSGLGAVAVAEAQDVPLSSEPTPDAVAAPTAQENNGLTGSTTAEQDAAPPSLPVPSVASHSLPSAVSPAAPQAGSVLSPSAQPSAAPTPVPANVNGTAPPQTALQQPAVAQRLPHDKVGMLEDRIKSDPKADTDAWLSLIAHYKEKEQYDNVRKVYQRFFEVFPTAAKMWLEYAQWEQSNDEIQRVEQILGGSLQQVLDIDMWRFYLDFIRRRTPLINDSDGSKRALISQVFDAVLDKVGIDPDAGELWREYIDFVKNGPGNVSGSGWQDLQKIDLVRKAYQRAVSLPHEELVKLWKEYDGFEVGLNRQAGRKNLNEQGASYMTAKAARTQLDSRLSGLDRSSLPKLPPVYGCQGEDEFGEQVERWRDWISFEKADELVLKNENDGAAYRQRVVYVLRQATMSLRFYPEIWYDAAAWCFEQERADMTEEGEKFLDEGIKANPESVLLALKKADRVESALPASTSDEIAIQNGEKLDVVYEGLHTALYGLREKYNEREKKALAEVQEQYAELPSEEENEDAEKADDDDDDVDAEEKPKTRKQQMEESLKTVKAGFDSQRELLKRTISYVWASKMRAFRRIQGQGAPKQPKKGFRGIFADARPRGMLTSEVYVASALLEHHCYRDPAATRIFERGLKLFPVDELFALEYVKHLVSINDLTNAKVVFETTLTKIQNTASIPVELQKEKCKPLLGYMHSFEANYGDLAQIHKLEKRMGEMYPDEPELTRFSHRFETPTFDALKAQLVLSPTQTRPRPAFPAYPVQPPPAAAIAAAMDGGEIRLGPHGPYVASPKRPLDDSDAETPSRKFLRGGDSPIKGAAGKRIATGALGAMSATVPTTNVNINTSGGGAGGGSGGFAVKNYVPGASNANAAPPPMQMQMPLLPEQIMGLLSRLPPPNTYNVQRFDPGRMVQFLRGLAL